MNYPEGKIDDTEYLQQLLADTRPEVDNPGQSSISSHKVSDETYLKILEIEQTNANTRWTITTFFFSVSFALFGFSFQAQLAYPLSSIARISGLSIYWFAYLIFRRFHANSNILRLYLRELEEMGRTHLDIQRRTYEILRKGKRRRLSITNLLLYFGILYSVSVILLWWLQL